MPKSDISRFLLTFCQFLPVRLRHLSFWMMGERESSVDNREKRKSGKFGVDWLQRTGFALATIFCLLLLITIWAARNFNQQMATGDYIALNLTIIEILLVIIALLVAGVSVFGFFKVTEIARARVEWYLREEIDLPTMLEPRIRDIITEKKDEWIGQALNQSEDIRNPDSEVENETQNDTG